MNLGAGNTERRREQEGVVSNSYYDSPAQCPYNATAQQLLVDTSNTHTHTG